METNSERPRSTYIGASEAAQIAGLSPWGGPFSVWQRKVGAVEDEPPPALRMWLGQRLEPVVRELYTARTGLHPRRHQRLVISKEHPFIGCHPDYTRLEVKTTRSANGWGPDGSTASEDDPSPVPVHYFLQVQHQLYCTGWAFSDLAVLIGHDDIRVYRVERAPGIIDQLVAAEVEFWQEYVLTNTPPPMDDSEAARDYLRATFPREREPLRIATPEEAQLMVEVAGGKEFIRAAEKRQDVLEARLKAAIGDATGLTNGTYRATWTASDRTDLDAAIMREELTKAGLTAILDKATRHKAIRTLRVTRTED